MGRPRLIRPARDSSPEVWPENTPPVVLLNQVANQRTLTNCHSNELKLRCQPLKGSIGLSQRGLEGGRRASRKSRAGLLGTSVGTILSPKPMARLTLS